MRKIQVFLESKNIRVHNLDYPSTQHDLSDLADQLIPAIKECAPAHAPTHFVGFSLGGLLLRLILTHYRPPVMGRVVQIAPPNQGSNLVDYIKHWRLFRYFYGPAGQVLDTQHERIHHLFGPIDYQLGVIAATQRYDWSVCWAFNEPHDGRVSVSRTKVTGMRDHIVLPGHHSTLMRSPIVHHQVWSFLQTGHFDHRASSSEQANALN